jgi:GNAT superfamily N-acetyltransferase
MIGIEYRRFGEVNEDFVGLASELDLEFAEKNGAAQDQYNQFNKLSGIGDIVIAYADGRPAACAALKKYDVSRYEVKRVYVRKEYRKLGLARAMMLMLEEIAAAHGAKSLILETSRTFVPAVSLYRSLSYAVTENYGQYKGMDLSVCMEKKLAPVEGKKN